MSRKAFFFATAVELVGIGLISMGLGVEIARQAHLGYVLITGGSALVAAGGVVFAKLLKR